MKINFPSQLLECPNFVAHEFCKGSGQENDIFSPLTGQKIGQFYNSTPQDVSHAIEEASSAQSDWAKTPLKERTQIMFKFRELLLRDINKISEIVSMENGKILSESKAGILKGIEVLEFALSLQNLDSAASMEVSRGVRCEYRRKPLGVVANITPFNFPAMVPMWTIPIVLTLGNSYVWKPSEKTPLTSLEVARLLKEAGLPSGVFTVLHGAQETVESIIDHENVKAIGFVGSTNVARKVYQRATSLGKRALALGGAKNHIVLLPDANPEIAGPGISDSFTGCAGQRCMAASVVLAVGEVDQHIQRIKERSQSQVLAQTMGAIITSEQVQFLSQAIDRAEKEGAKILLDGRKSTPPKGFEGGNWIGPTILDHVTPGSEAASVELFGPILSIIRCPDINQAMKVQNQSEYGNACSVFTSSGPLAEKVLSQAQAGMLGVNIGVPVPREPFSFGGVEASKFGHGDITGTHSLNFWSDVLKVTTKWEKQNDQSWMS